MKPCFCGRASRGFWFYPKLLSTGGSALTACCSQHLDMAIKMIDPTEYEQEAIAYGGEQAGKYLETLGKTDLATMSPEEWSAFIEVIVTGYVDRLGEIAAHLADASVKMKAKVTAADIPY